jgi:hypothetical protein
MEKFENYPTDEYIAVKGINELQLGQRKPLKSSARE